MENIDYEELYDLMHMYSEGICYTCKAESRTLKLDPDFGIGFYIDNKTLLLNCRNCRRLEFVREELLDSTGEEIIQSSVLLGIACTQFNANEDMSVDDFEDYRWIDLDDL